MVAPLFGWSAGDIVQSIKLIHVVYKAFKEQGGATEKYQANVTFLKSFESTLKYLKEYTAQHSEDEYSAEIKEQTESLDRPWKVFTAFLDPFKKALGGEGASSAIQRAFKKVKWSLKELSGEVDKLRTAVVQPQGAIGILLSLVIVKRLSKGSQSLQMTPEFVEEMLRALNVSGIYQKVDEALNEAIQNQSHQSASMIEELRGLEQSQEKAFADLKESLTSKQYETSVPLEEVTNNHDALLSALEALNVQERNTDKEGSRIIQEEVEGSLRLLRETAEEQQMMLTEFQMSLENLLEYIKEANTLQRSEQSAQFLAVANCGQWAGMMAETTKAMLVRQHRAARFLAFPEQNSPAIKMDADKTFKRYAAQDSWNEAQPGSLRFSVPGNARLAVKPSLPYRTDHSPSSSDDWRIMYSKSGSSGLGWSARIPEYEWRFKLLNVAHCERLEPRLSSLEGSYSFECFKCEQTTSHFGYLLRHLDLIDPMDHAWSALTNYKKQHTPERNIKPKLKPVFSNFLDHVRKFEEENIRRSDSSKSSKIRRLCAICDNNFTSRYEFYLHFCEMGDKSTTCWNSTCGIKVSVSYMPRDSLGGDIITYIADRISRF